LRTEGFFYNLDILYGGLGIGKLQFLIKKKYKKIFSCNFFQFLVIKALDPYWSPTSNSGSGSGKNEYGSTTMTMIVIWIKMRRIRSIPIEDFCKFWWVPGTRGLLFNF
jgi:hypothetical protein